MVKMVCPVLDKSTCNALMIKLVLYAFLGRIKGCFISFKRFDQASRPLPGESESRHLGEDFIVKAGSTASRGHLTIAFMIPAQTNLTLLQESIKLGLGQGNLPSTLSGLCQPCMWNSLQIGLQALVLANFSEQNDVKQAVLLQTYMTRFVLQAVLWP